MMLAIIGVSLGYILKVEIQPSYGRILAGTVILISLFWYICSFAAFRLSSRLRDAIAEAARILVIPFHPEEYRALDTIMIAAFSCMVPVVAIFSYFVISPPVISH
jgi:hypothetical protein